MAQLPSINPFYEPPTLPSRCDIYRVDESVGDVPYVTEVCLGPSSSSSKSIVSDEETDTLEPVWLQYIDGRGELFYLESEESPSSEAEVNLDPESVTNHKYVHTNGSALYSDGRNNTTTNRNFANLPERTRHGTNGYHENVVRKPEKQKEVLIMANPRNCHTVTNDQNGVIYCEKLFGIILCQYRPRVPNGALDDFTRVQKDRKLIVQGVVPGSEAEKSRQIHRGDMLLCVADVSITWNNLDNVLRSISRPAQVKLTFQSPVVVGPSPPQPQTPVPLTPPGDHTLVKALLGEATPFSSPSLNKLPHAVLYLSLDCNSESMSSKEDIVYLFPSHDSKLVDLRGTFLTLSSVLIEVTNNSARNSTVLWENHTVNVAYHKEGRDVLILCLPAKVVPLHHLNHVLSDVIRILKVSFGSVVSAFRHKENVSQCDQLFSLLFHRMLQSQEMYLLGLNYEQTSRSFLDSLSGVRWIQLEDSAKVEYDNILSELEAGDFTDDDEEIAEMRRTYTVLGSSVFYKGFLCCNHLTCEDFQDVFLFLKYHCVLAYTSEYRVRHLVLWHELFPSRRFHTSEDSAVPGYTEPDARYFLLVVGMRNTILSVMLEAGGCAAWADGRPSPDPFYVDQVKASLLQLEGADLTETCETRLQLIPGGPSLVGADWVLASSSRGKEETPQQSPMSKIQNSSRTVLSPPKMSSDSNSRWKASPQADRRPVSFGGDSDDTHSLADFSVPSALRRQSHRSSNGSLESGGSGSSSGAQRGRSRGLQDMSALSRSLGTLQDNTLSKKITHGVGNILFHYISLECSEGVYVCPSQHELSLLNGAIHSQVLANFHRCSLQIHKQFEAAKQKQLQCASKSYRFSSRQIQSEFREQAVLFQFMPGTWNDPKKPPPTLSYWVIGRVFPPPYSREVYVCIHDSANQNLVEMAFSLCWGVTT